MSTRRRDIYPVDEGAPPPPPDPQQGRRNFHLQSVEGLRLNHGEPGTMSGLVLHAIQLFLSILILILTVPIMHDLHYVVPSFWLLIVAAFIQAAWSLFGVIYSYFFRLPGIRLADIFTWGDFACTFLMILAWFASSGMLLSFAFEAHRCFTGHCSNFVAAVVIAILSSSIGFYMFLSNYFYTFVSRPFRSQP